MLSLLSGKKYRITTVKHIVLFVLCIRPLSFTYDNNLVKHAAILISHCWHFYFCLDNYCWLGLLTCKNRLPYNLCWRGRKTLLNQSINRQLLDWSVWFADNCFTGRYTTDISQWTDWLGINWSRWIWCCLPSKTCTIWYSRLQRTLWSVIIWLIRSHFQADEIHKANMNPLRPIGHPC